MRWARPPYVGENVTIRDDYAHPLNPGMPFDYEGTPTQRLTLIESGVAQNIVTDPLVRAKLDRAEYRPRTAGAERRGTASRAHRRRPGTRLARGTDRRNQARLARQPILVHAHRRSAQDDRHRNDARRNVPHRRRQDRARRAQHALQPKHLEALQGVEFSSELRRTGGYSYSRVVPSAARARLPFHERHRLLKPSVPRGRRHARLGGSVILIFIFKEIGRKPGKQSSAGQRAEF